MSKITLGHACLYGEVLFGALLKQSKTAVRISMDYGRGIFYESEYHTFYPLVLLK